MILAIEIFAKIVAELVIEHVFLKDPSRILGIVRLFRRF